MTTMFLVIAIVSSAFLGIQLLLLMFGADMDFDSDMDADAGDGTGFLSVRSLTAFFGGFGWAGLAGRQAGWSGTNSILLGLGVGVAMFFVVGFLFLQARKLTSSGNADLATAVGQEGTVYVTVPALRGGTGKVELTVSGRVSVMNAVTDAEEDLVTRSSVRVVALSGSTLVVERV